MNAREQASAAARKLADGFAKLSDAQLLKAARNPEDRPTLAYQLQAIDKHTANFPHIAAVLAVTRERLESALRKTAGEVSA